VSELAARGMNRPMPYRRIATEEAAGRRQGHAAGPGIARINAEDALAIGLLDQIVADADLIQTAIATVRRWTQPGAATTAHLGLLRPPLSVIEQSFAAETEATRITEAAGLGPAGINRFLSRRHDGSS
jgi:enoyl-CoA hydratase/carnithine racemase